MNMYLKIGLVVILASLTVEACDTSCSVKAQPIGCYKDESTNRAMAEYFLTARENLAGIFAGYFIDWKNWPQFLSKFVCDCAKVAQKKGYKVFGVQFFGECWGSINGHLDYAKFGESKSCVRGNMDYAECTKGDTLCSGQTLTNFVYQVAPTECDIDYEPVGCFKDNQNIPRPLPDYVMNERDYRHSNWNGYLIDWKNWNTYIPKMICRCAAKAKELNRTTFSLQFYGECWSGEESAIQYDRDGPYGRCLAEDFDPCPCNSFHCVGQDFANSVYRLR